MRGGNGFHLCIQYLRIKIVDFLHGLSNSLLQGFGDMQKHGGLCNEIAEGIEKSRKKLFTIGVSIALAGIGFFLILWRGI